MAVSCAFSCRHVRRLDRASVDWRALGYILAEYVLRAFADVKGPGLVMELGASIMMMDNSIAISFIFPPLRSASLS